MVINGKIREVMEDMGMLKSISLENYKCFKKKTDIDIAPLTVLCGVNSSGKSSILKSLLMLKQTAESNVKNFSIALSGDLVDNGCFDNVIYDGNDREINTFTTIDEFRIRNHKLLILRILKTGISLEAMPPWVSENGFSSFQAVC